MRWSFSCGDRSWLPCSVVRRKRYDSSWRWNEKHKHWRSRPQVMMWKTVHHRSLNSASWEGCSVQSRLSVCLSVCLFVRALKETRLELLSPNFVRVYFIAVARHALTQRSKGQGHMVPTVTVSRLLVTRAAMAVCCCRRGSACRYDCLCFLFSIKSTSLSNYYF